jgi:hypothetical protein
VVKKIIGKCCVVLILWLMNYEGVYVVGGGIREWCSVGVGLL